MNLANATDDWENSTILSPSEYSMLRGVHC